MYARVVCTTHGVVGGRTPFYVDIWRARAQNGIPFKNMLAFLNNYIILADANVWLQKGFHTAVKPAAIMRQLQVPHLVEQELRRLQKNKKVSHSAEEALQFIKEHNVPVLPPSSVSHLADQEFIMYGMENAGKPLAVVTHDTGLQNDLAALCPDLLVLDCDKGACTPCRPPEYAEKVKAYRDVIASAAVAGRADFPLLAKLLLEAGIEKLLVSPSLPEDHANAKCIRGIEGVKPMPALGVAGEGQALLARLLVHEGKQRALLLLAEGEDTLTYMKHRDTKLKSVDNTGFDVAVMDAVGGITVLEPKETPLPPRKQAQPVPKVPAEERPGCLAMRQAAKDGNKALAQKHLVEALKESLRNGRYTYVNQLLDAARELEIGQPKSVLKFYLNEVLDGYARQKEWKSLKTRFIGKAGKKVLTRLIKNAPVSNISAAPTHILNEWKKTSETDEQREAIAAFEGIIKNAQKQD